MPDQKIVVFFVKFVFVCFFLFFMFLCVYFEYVL